VASNTDDCGDFKGDPDSVQPEEHAHFIKPEYVGPTVALEVVEAWYKAVQTHRHPFIIHHDHNLERFVKLDVFGVGLGPTDVPREVVVVLNMNDIVCRSGSTPTEAIPRPSLEVLLKIKSKYGFQLDIALRQQRIRLNDWLLAFDSCRRDLPAEGALIRIYWTYHEPETSPIERDFDVIFAGPKPDWRKDIIEFLDSVSY
jgi:hypothetical protein